MFLGESVFSSLNHQTHDGLKLTTLPLMDDKVSLTNFTANSVASTSIAAAAATSLEIDNDVFNSVFASDAPLFEESCSSEDLAAIFNDSTNVPIKQEEGLDDELMLLMSPPVVDHVEARSMSAPVGSLSLYTESQQQQQQQQQESFESSKRSFSVMSIKEEEEDALSVNIAKKSKKDKLGCTPYTRKQRAAPLQPIVPKGEDVASLKRARNTEAARRSRARKMERMTQLETKCEVLLKENNALKMEIKALRNLLNKNG